MNDFERALNLRRHGELNESNMILRKLVQVFPNDALINYHCAWSFDIIDQEKAAIPFYEKAISLGLNEDDLRGAYLGLGSTYRTIGEYIKSKDNFEKAMATFPNDNALKVFYAMTLYNLNEHSLSMEILLTLLADTSSDSNINRYREAIKFYSNKLPTLW
jgi:tetratricopeptide (TPR) repeat protein